MKKLLLIAMVMMSLPMFAQNYTMRASGIMAEDGWEAWDYIYATPEGTDLICINKHDFIDQLEIIDSVFRDENGYIQRLSTWQLIEGEWKLACYCDYTYNEMGLRTSRTNYNNFSSGLELGGIYTYEYDENGTMTNWQLSFAGIDDWQKATISFNEKGLKEAEVILQYNFSTYYHEQQYITEFEYDDNGNNTRVIEFVANESGTMATNSIREYEYDDLGNCVMEQQLTAGGTVQERIIYTYDTSVSSEKIYYYENPELDWPRLPQVKNLLKSFEYWAQNQDNGELVHAADYLYLYEVIAEDDAVEEVAFNTNIYPNPTQDFVMVESSDADYVEVVDIYGRVMFSSEMNETVKVDMSEFASGIYFVKLQAGDATSVQKIMKK